MAMAVDSRRRPDDKLIRSELQKVLAPEYVQAAFSLPFDSGTIWHQIKDDIEATQLSRDPQLLVTALGRFFSKGIPEALAQNLEQLDDSFLGSNYTLMPDPASVGAAVVDGICEDAVEKGTPLAGFLGRVSYLDLEEFGSVPYLGDSVKQDGPSCSGGGGGQQRGQGRGRGAGRPREKAGGRGQQREEAGGRGPQGGGAGGQGGGGGEAVPRQHFTSMDERRSFIHLSAFQSPLKSDHGRTRKIRDRSAAFSEAVQDWQQHVYDQHSHRNSLVSLYHGTRTSSLDLFGESGILPSGVPGEFHRFGAFYCTNSVRLAFERPLHKKPARSVGDSVSVLKFRLDTRVLHGERAAQGEETPFKVLWFPSSDEEWKKFCLGNMSLDRRKSVPPHTYDLVIGPVCIPIDGFTDMDVVRDRLEAGDHSVQVMQVAFCSPRSWSWVERYFNHVYTEVRGEVPGLDGAGTSAA